MEASYQALGADGEEDLPQDIGVMIHVVPETGRAARWNHVDDLDSFFIRTYLYHQKHGFTCMMLQETLELFQFIFVLVFSIFLFHCVDYPVLFRDKIKPSKNATEKISLNDAILPSDVCIANFGILTWSCFLFTMLFWLLRVVKVFYHLFQYWDVKAFYNSALKIDDSNLDNLTWHEVQHRIREVQLEQQMCIHKKDLSELDIYHRILRFKNYLVAMVNKSLLPVRFNVPFIGEVVFLSHGLKYNIELLLFWGPWAPFQNNWHLKEDYKKVNKRHELAGNLSKHILWVAIINFLLCPIIFLWQILYSFFNYAQIIKREPGTLGSRCWSLYGKLYLRHFNELDHELNARLNRGYRPASKYMNIFTSPVMTVIAKNVVFISGSILAVLLVLTVYDEDVITIEHVLTIMTLLGSVVACFRTFIPDENLVWCPENLMTAILAHAHYLPEHWRGQAHTSRVRGELAQLFQYKAVFLLAELLSPIVTPFILFFHFRNRALDIVDFFRNFTVEVVGVGDVCSFAQMNVQKHGNPTWQVAPTGPNITSVVNNNQYNQAEDGKTELSLVHFTVTNPNWQLPAEAQHFVTAVKSQVRRDANMLNNEMFQAAQIPEYFGGDNSLSSLGIGPSAMLLRPTVDSLLNRSMSQQCRGVSRVEGPQSIYNPFCDSQERTEEQPSDFTMSLSTLYLHELHHRHKSQVSDRRRRQQHHMASGSSETINPRLQVQESTPLLHNSPRKS